MSRLLGAECLPLKDVAEWADWLIEGASQPQSVPSDLRFAVLQCWDALVWGIWDGTAWAWASGIKGSGVRAPRVAALTEARVFGPSAEILLWRVEDNFLGRRLADASAPLAFPEHKPLTRLASFEGSEERLDDMRFVRRVEDNGRTTITPPGKALKICEYLEEDPEISILRIAATRFVTLVPGENV